MSQETDTSREPIVTITWCALDLMEQYGYSEEKATELLENIASDLEDRSIELGWQTIDILLAMQGEGDDDDEEEEE